MSTKQSGEKDVKVISKAAQRRKLRAEKREEKRKEKRPKRRIFPIWLRIIVFLFACVIALAAGSMIGYGLIGDGNMMDVFKVKTWQHIIDIVKKRE